MLLDVEIRESVGIITLKNEKKANCFSLELVEEVIVIRKDLNEWCQKPFISNPDNIKSNIEMCGEFKKLLAEPIIEVLSEDLILNSSIARFKREKEVLYRNWQHTVSDVAWRDNYTDEERDKRESDYKMAYAEYKKWSGRDGAKHAKMEHEYLAHAKEVQDRKRNVASKHLEIYNAYKNREYHAELAVKGNKEARAYANLTQTPITGLKIEPLNRNNTTTELDPKKKKKKNDGIEL